MKKAKIMLTSIAVLAVVGGALAFKVKADANVFCKINVGTPQLTCEKKLYRTQFLPNRATTDPCPEETVWYSETECITAKIETLNTVYTTIND